MRDTDPVPSDELRRTQLRALVDGLTTLIGVLAHDPNPARPWQRHFVDCRRRAAALAQEVDAPSAPLSQARLSELAGSVMSVYRGMGSFTDYAPLVPTPSGGYALPPGLETLIEVSGQVYDAALALRVVGDVR